MEYRESAPAAALAPFVTTFWTLSGCATHPAFDLVLPDGHAELVVHRTGRFRQWHARGRATEQPAALVAGVMDRAIVLAPAPAFETVGVRFTAHGLAPLCRHSQDHLGARLAPAGDVLGAGARRVVADVAQADSTGEAMRLLELGLLRLYRDVPAPSRRMIAAVDLIRRTGGTVTMDRLTRATGASSRWLERQFHAAVGLPPKRYARIVRFHRAVSSLAAAPDVAGATLALRHGYYDQAHFTTEFKAVTGWAPKAFVSERFGELTRHFVLSDSSKTAPPA